MRGDRRTFNPCSALLCSCSGETGYIGVMGAPLRLKPTMRSRKLLALEFICEYWAEHNYSPSFGEIGAALGHISNSRVNAIVRKLADEQLIGHRPGVPRSITLPSSREEALRVLRAEGWPSHELIARIVRDADVGTKATLPLVPELDHVPDLDDGDMRDANG